MLKKDLIELCLLHLLDVEDLYGYEILHRGLCKDGCTKQYEGKVSEGPTRKYYHITEAGQSKRKKLLNEWRRLRDTLIVLGIE